MKWTLTICSARSSLALRVVGVEPEAEGEAIGEAVKVDDGGGGSASLQ